jgi:hypothetical protein
MSSDDAQVASSAFRAPPLQFYQHWPQRQVIRDANNESSFRNLADEHWRAAAHGGSAEPLTESGVGASGVHHGESTSQVELSYRGHPLGNLGGGESPRPTPLSGKKVGAAGRLFFSPCMNKKRARRRPLFGNVPVLRISYPFRIAVRFCDPRHYGEF